MSRLDKICCNRYLYNIVITHQNDIWAIFLEFIWTNTIPIYKPDGFHLCIQCLPAPGPNNTSIGFVFILAQIKLNYVIERKLFQRFVDNIQSRNTFFLPKKIPNDWPYESFVFLRHNHTGFIIQFHTFLIFPIRDISFSFDFWNQNRCTSVAAAVRSTALLTSIEPGSFLSFSK